METVILGGLGAGAGVAGVIGVGVTIGAARNGVVALRRRGITVFTVAAKVSKLIDRLSLFERCSRLKLSPKANGITVVDPLEFSDAIAMSHKSISEVGDSRSNSPLSRAMGIVTTPSGSTLTKHAVSEISHIGRIDNNTYIEELHRLQDLNQEIEEEIGEIQAVLTHRSMVLDLSEAPNSVNNQE